MDTWLWVVIVLAVAAVICIAAWAIFRARRTKTLKEQFGGEYDRVAADAPTKREAEAELKGRAERREELDIRPLDADRREWYRVQWTKVQAGFVDDPGEAVADADGLIQRVMVLLRYDDVPGVIGRVGTLFGEAGVNIAQMAVSRNIQGGKALMALSIDSEAPPELLERLREGMDDAHVIQ